MHKRRLAVLLCLVVLSSPHVMSSDAQTSSDYRGPLVTNVVFLVFNDAEEQVLALLDGQIDLIGNAVNASLLPSLASETDLEVANVPRNGYGYLAIKTDKYPLNMTDFRRALAFAIDKEKISDDLWDGLSVPQDSCVVRGSPFSIEDQLVETYYESDMTVANQLLDDAGFTDLDIDGWREAPDGSELDVAIECSNSSIQSMGVADMIAQTLIALRVNSTSAPTAASEYVGRVYSHGDFDMAVLEADFDNPDVQWLVYEYGSDYADQPGHNPSCWKNVTYDSWSDQLLHSTDFDEVYEAAVEMQKIWIHECPAIVCYNNFFLSVYRTDRFDGFVNGVMDGVPCWWTNYRIHLKGYSPYYLASAAFRRSIAADADSFNFMTSTSASTWDILENLYDGLQRRDPNGESIPWLATDWLIETHSDNVEVPVNHTRLIFSMAESVLWSDGVALTAEDVAFTMQYYRESEGNPFGLGLDEMVATYAMDSMTAVIEFSSKSFWHLSSVAYKPILPKHVLENLAAENWSTWDPAPQDLVTSGPFLISDYSVGEFYELTYNPLYFALPLAAATTDTVVDLTTGPWPPAYLWYGSLAAASLSVALVLYLERVKGRGVRRPPGVPAQ